MNFLSCLRGGIRFIDGTFPAAYEVDPRQSMEALRCENQAKNEKHRRDQHDGRTRRYVGEVERHDQADPTAKQSERKGRDKVTGDRLRPISRGSCRQDHQPHRHQRAKGLEGG